MRVVCVKKFYSNTTRRLYRPPQVLEWPDGKPLSRAVRPIDEPGPEPQAPPDPIEVVDEEPVADNPGFETLEPEMSTKPKGTKKTAAKV